MTPRNLLTLTTSSAALLLLLLAAPGCPTDPPADDDDATSDDDDSAGDDDDATLPDDELDCTGADEATCGATASGTSVGADNNVYGYAICDLNATGFTGGEAVYEFTAANAGEHTFELTWSDATNDIDLFVLDLCSTDVDDGGTCLGYSIEEMRQLTGRMLTSEKHAALVDRLSFDLHARGRARTMRMLCERKDGSTFFAMLTASSYEVEGVRRRLLKTQLREPLRWEGIKPRQRNCSR